MEITIQMPLPHSTARIAAAMTAIEKHTYRTFRACIVEPPEYDPNRIDVRGTVKGIGAKTWEKWTMAVIIALKKIPE